MIRINLLPAGLEAAPSRINPTIPMTMAVLIPAIVLVPFHLHKMSSRKKLQNEVDSLKSELKRYEPIIAQVEALEKAKLELTNRKGVIQQLENERLRYPQFFDDFVKLIPNNIWLTNLVTTMSPTSPALTINMDVTALDNYAIADLVSNLESSQIFTEVDLGAIAATQNTMGGMTMTFRVTAKYQKAETPPDATQKS
jgi:Tfp pilus assembly protein PilN